MPPVIYICCHQGIQAKDYQAFDIDAPTHVCKASAEPCCIVQHLACHAHTWHYFALHVAQDVVKALALLWRFWRQERPQVARLNLRAHRPLMHSLVVIAHEIYHLFATPPELRTYYNSYSCRFSALRSLGNIHNRLACKPLYLFNIHRVLEVWYCTVLGG